MSNGFGHKDAFVGWQEISLIQTDWEEEQVVVAVLKGEEAVVVVVMKDEGAPSLYPAAS